MSVAEEAVREPVYGDLEVEPGSPGVKDRRGYLLAGALSVLLAGSIYGNLRQTERYVDAMAMQAARRFRAYHEAQKSWPFGSDAFDVPGESQLFEFCQEHEVRFNALQGSTPETVIVAVDYPGTFGEKHIRLDAWKHPDAQHQGHERLMIEPPD